MQSPRRPFLLSLMLIAIAMRAAFGAPCCMEPAMSGQAAGAAMVQVDHAAHSVPADHSTDPHAGHSDDPAANPCCSACGPTLPPDPAVIAHPPEKRAYPLRAAFRILATRPPFPAYDATGPPLLI